METVYGILLGFLCLVSQVSLITCMEQFIFGNGLKLLHYTVDMLHMVGTFYTDSWLIVFFLVFLISSLGGVINLVRAFYTMFLLSCFKIVLFKICLSVHSIRPQGLPTVQIKPLKHPMG